MKVSPINDKTEFFLLCGDSGGQYLGLIIDNLGGYLTTMVYLSQKSQQHAPFKIGFT